MSEDKDRQRTVRARLERLRLRLRVAMPMQGREAAHLAAVLNGIIDLLEDEL